ncbi:hypothetical protein PI126_g7142 [Phytophthora idaei]|nr:hypothetical protein PI126_g7142 [Phytophthora idaei]
MSVKNRMRVTIDLTEDTDEVFGDEWCGARGGRRCVHRKRRRYVEVGRVAIESTCEKIATRADTERKQMRSLRSAAAHCHHCRGHSRWKSSSDRAGNYSHARRSKEDIDVPEQDLASRIDEAVKKAVAEQVHDEGKQYLQHIKVIREVVKRDLQQVKMLREEVRQDLQQMKALHGEMGQEIECMREELQQYLDNKLKNANAQLTSALGPESLISTLQSQVWGPRWEK